MKHLVLVFVLVSFPSIALAQLPGDDTGTEPSPPPPPPPDPPPAPPPPPPAIAPAIEPEPDPVPAVGARSMRPEAFSIAIGLGWDLPADLQAPNITSVRFRLPSGLTFEPQFEFARASSRVDNGVPPDTEVTTTNTGLAVLARKPLLSNGKVDFEVIGAAGFARSVVNPDMADNDTTRSAFVLAYGLAVGYWFSPHVYLTLSGLNPIVTSASETEEMGPGMTTETSSTAFGAEFDPNVTVMIHLYN